MSCLQATSQCTDIAFDGSGGVTCQTGRCAIVFCTVGVPMLPCLFQTSHKAHSLRANLLCCGGLMSPYVSSTLQGRTRQLAGSVCCSHDRQHTCFLQSMACHMLHCIVNSSWRDTGLLNVMCVLCNCCILTCSCSQQHMLSCLLQMCQQHYLQCIADLRAVHDIPFSHALCCFAEPITPSCVGLQCQSDSDCCDGYHCGSTMIGSTKSCQQGGD